MKRSLIGAEFKEIVTNRKVIIPIIAVLFVPVLYAGMFLWAFWDPYAHLKDLPVAVVNNDKGADFEGEQLKLGKDLVKELKKVDEFNFKFVDHDKAYRDLENRKYYMVVEIPENFSKNATTLLDDHPKKLQLKYVPNESFNFLSAQIGETAMKEIRAELQKNITKTYAETMFDKIKDVADGLDKASDGAKQLNDGAIKLSDGSKKIKSNLETLASKSIEFTQGVNKANDGTKQLASGARELNSGLGQLKNGHGQLLNGTNELKKGTDQLAAGIGKVHTGLNTVDGKMNELIAGTNQAAAGVQQFAGSLPELQSKTGQLASGATQVDQGIGQLQSQLVAQQKQMEQLAGMLQQTLPPEQFAQIAAKLPSPEQGQKLQESLNALKNGSSQVAAGTGALNQTIANQVVPNMNKLNGGLNQISSGQKQLKDGIHALALGSGDLHTGVQKLQAGEKELLSGMSIFNQKLGEAQAGTGKLAIGADTLTNGLNQLSDGSAKISEGTHKLAEGSKDLSDGTDQLSDGTNELHEKLSDGAEQANSVDAKDGNYEMMAEPVKVENKGIHKVPNYGTGFAPYFLSLGLFVGALLLSIVFPLREPAVRPKSGLAWFFSKFGILVGIGIAQALLADGILLLGLGIEVQSVPLFIFTTIITSITFVTLIQMLVSIMGDPGRFIAILVLIFQLTTSAGTFPLELIPKVLQPINALLPMTYSVSALKAVVSSGDYSFLWYNVSILLSFTVFFAVLTAIFFIALHKRQFSRTVTEE
ncbi:putative membrane protein [Oikeobacillus pervagus]|uniref:Membrane protein n=1 Tax=Oikeobacillus pervagus TaxID=1325931 RepID=A0AAJ1SYC9_9BACI|nr:YhgE/Pip domain-containing protein [Oikeobacillus pervagus]MDQ0214769.1 putative membrane protein [Oikeobacillus pervagus]